MSINLTIHTVNGQTFTVPFEQHQNFETFITNVKNEAVEQNMANLRMYNYDLVLHMPNHRVRTISETNFDAIKNNLNVDSVLFFQIHGLRPDAPMEGGAKRRSKKSSKKSSKESSKKSSKKSPKKSMKGGAKRKSKKKSKKTSRK